MMRRPVYAIAGFLGSLPMGLRVVMAIPLVILGALSIAELIVRIF